MASDTAVYICRYITNSHAAHRLRWNYVGSLALHLFVYPGCGDHGKPCCREGWFNW